MCNVAGKSKRNVNNNSASAESILWILKVSCVFALLLQSASAEPLKVVYALNAGGSEHTDQNGIHYEADPLNVGIASDYGKHLLMIGRVHEEDEVLYRTERYHTTTFGYDFPADGDGDYALIMKFCEVYFDAPNRKVFDVLLNRRHTVIKQLDIYNHVGRGSAHDEIVYFKIVNGRLQYEFEGEIETSDVRNGHLRLDFIKGALDNPKINAFALLKGDMSQLSRLHNSEASDRRADTEEEDALKAKKTRDNQQHQERIVRYNERQAQRGYDDEEDEDDDEMMEQLPQQPSSQQQQNQQHSEQKAPDSSQRMRSGPRQPSPYSMDDSSILMPVFIAIGAFIPLLFCLCKL
ncbi:CG9257 [Drosophila busckii]|uniref:CG9257 n=1 Tax=Drosophila busckii TaxID=30019 RepID=A0A0M3QUB6_DROBS|nr:malectin-A [Drosophila busckii]ALC38089.1 CG9257 [Drosophila busckii]ALC40349.1 CG9257 [Drosophila busckii]